MTRVLPTSPDGIVGVIGVLDMKLLSVIRRWRYREHMPIREIERRTGLSRNTIRKYLRSNTVEVRFKGAGAAEPPGSVCRQAGGLAAGRGRQGPQDPPTIGTILLAVGGIGGAAMAETTGPGFDPPFMHGLMGQAMGPGMMWMRGGAQGQGFGDPAARLTALKTDLGIRPEQASAWDAYAKVVQDTATQIPRMIRVCDTTVFITTQNIKEADRLCHSLAISNQGRLAAVATPLVLRARIDARRSVAVRFAVCHASCDSSLQLLLAH